MLHVLAIITARKLCKSLLRVKAKRVFCELEIGGLEF